LDISHVYKNDNSSEQETRTDAPVYSDWKDWIDTFSIIKPWGIWDLLEIDTSSEKSKVVAPYFCQM
jgi:hypothetical protein